MEQKGFTFIELISTVAITVILGGMGVPSFLSILEKKNADTTAYTVFHTFQKARTEAITRGEIVTLCGSNDGVNCEKEWQKSLVVFVDKDRNRRIDPEELISQVYLELKDDSVKTKVSLGRPYIDFKSTGVPKQWGNFIYCPKEFESKSLYRRVTWNRIGRPYYGKDYDGDGVVDATNGDPLSC